MPLQARAPLRSAEDSTPSHPAGAFRLGAICDSLKQCLELSGGLDKEGIDLIRDLAVGKSVKVNVVGESKPRRSTLQNAYYWACVVPAFVEATDSSYSTDDFHHWLKCEIFGVKKIGNREVPEFGTSDLNTDQMERYLTRCRDIGMDVFQVHIPKPNETPYRY